MDDEPRPLSLDEKNNLHMKVLIPAFPIFFFFVGYLVYRMDTNPFKSMPEILLEWFLPFFISSYVSMMFTIEFFYHRIVRKSLRFHARRFGMNVLLGGLLIISLLVVLISLFPILSPYMGEKIALSVSIFSWALLVAVIVFKFQHSYQKYWKEF